MSETATERVAEIRARAEGATPGPWRHGSLGGVCSLDHYPHGRGACDYRARWNDGSGVYAGAPEEGGPYPKDITPHVVAGMWDYEEGGVRLEADAEFIAHAREDVPWLLARLDEQAERVRVLEEALLPFAEAFAAQVEATPDGARRDWNARMPGGWACPVTVTMGDGRVARRALGAGEGATHG